MPEPRVSVLVAAYKSHHYLRAAIQSVVAQTFGDFEVIVSDDAADPGVEELVARFQDARLKYRQNFRTLGPAGNHWAALGAAQGTYVAILNHDDLWRPAFLSNVVGALDRSSEAVLAFCDHDVIGSDGNVLPAETEATTRQWGRDRLSPGLHRPFAELVVLQSIPMATGTIFRRTALDPATLPEVGPAYDLFLAYALARTGGGACYVPERLTAWRVHPSQLTNEGPADWSHGNLLCWCTAAKDPLFAAYRREIADKIATAAVTLAKRCLGQGDGAGARSYAKLALRQQPANWRALAAFGLSLAPRRLARWLVDRRGHYGQ